jgi:hypothetical protein
MLPPQQGRDDSLRVLLAQGREGNLPKRYQSLGYPRGVNDSINGSIRMKLTRFRGARQAFNGGFSDAQDASALFT